MLLLLLDFTSDFSCVIDFAVFAFTDFAWFVLLLLILLVSFFVVASPAFAVAVAAVFVFFFLLYYCCCCWFSGCFLSTTDVEFY